MRPRLSVIAAGGLLAVGLVAVGVTASSNDDIGADGGADARPVLRAPATWESYPTALVIGTLSLQDGCLLLDHDVVFWPHDTGWDADAQAVTFPHDPPAPVGATFRGGGGFYSDGQDALDGLAVEDAVRDALRSCLDAVDGSGLVLAWASIPVRID